VTTNRNNAKRILVTLAAATKRASIQLAVNIHGRLVEDTPKDTGWAASNWVPNIGSAFRTLAGSPESINNSPQARGLNNLLNWNFEQPVYISNNVPYIQVLNTGTSIQAPSMFVETIIQSEVARYNRKRLR